MKVIRFLVIVGLLNVLGGCSMFMEEESYVVLSFWTDRDISEDTVVELLINDESIGNLVGGIENPDCMELKLLNYEMEKSEDLNISVLDEQDELIEIGVVNLYSVSQGIKIKPADDAEIFVNRSLDDDCTLVYVNWN